MYGKKSEKLEIIVNQVKVGKRVRNIADPDDIRWLSLQYPVQLSGTPGDLEGWEEKLLPGKQVKMACSFRLTEPAKNPGEFDAKLYYRSKGVVCTGYIKALKESSGADQPFMRLILWFRRYCSHVLEEYGGKEDSSIYKAMLLGDTSFIGDGYPGSVPQQRDRPLAGGQRAAFVTDRWWNVSAS